MWPSCKWDRNRYHDVINVGCTCRQPGFFNHRQTNRCTNAAERKLWRRDVEMSERCGEMEFSLEGGREIREGGGCSDIPVPGKSPIRNG